MSGLLFIISVVGILLFLSKQSKNNLSLTHTLKIPLFFLILILFFSVIGCSHLSTNPEQSNSEKRSEMENKKEILLEKYSEYMQRNFEKTDWYGFIKDKSISGSTLLLNTSLSQGYEGRYYAQKIGMATVVFVSSKENEYLKITKIVVLDKNNETLITYP